MNRAFLLTVINRLDSIILELFFRYLSELPEDAQKVAIKLYRDLKINDQIFTRAIQNINNCEKIKYPFDIFGSKVFLNFYDKFNYADKFPSYVSKKLIVYIEHNKLLEMLANILLFRNFLEHKKPKSDQIKFKNKTIIFDLNRSFYYLCLFLPKDLSKNICDKLCSSTDDVVFKEKLQEYYKNALEKNKKYIEKLNIENSPEDHGEFIKIYYNTNKLQRYTLYQFIKEYKFIGEYNLSRCKGVITETVEITNKRDNAYLFKHKKKNFFFEELQQIFNFILEVNTLFHRYFTKYFDLIKPTNNSKEYKKFKKLRNSISHSHLFFNEYSEEKLYIEKLKSIEDSAKKPYIEKLMESIEHVLLFYDTTYKDYHMANKTPDLQNYKQMKSSFINSLKSLLNRKDYLYLILKNGSYNTITKICIKKDCFEQKGTAKKITKSDARKYVSSKINDIKQNPNNANKEISVDKWKRLNLLRQEIKINLIKIKEKNILETKKS